MLFGKLLIIEDMMLTAISTIARRLVLDERKIIHRVTGRSPLTTDHPSAALRKASPDLITRYPYAGHEWRRKL